eukprot:4263228-Amphidinium_carterae.1
MQTASIASNMLWKHDNGKSAYEMRFASPLACTLRFLDLRDASQDALCHVTSASLGFNPEIPRPEWSHAAGPCVCCRPIARWMRRLSRTGVATRCVRA